METPQAHQKSSLSRLDKFPEPNSWALQWDGAALSVFEDRGNGKGLSISFGRNGHYPPKGKGEK